jgi:hypothetical protein
MNDTLATQKHSQQNQTENDTLPDGLFSEVIEALRAYLEDRPDGSTLRTLREGGEVVAVVYELGTTKRIESEEEAREALDTLRTAGYGGEA